MPGIAGIVGPKGSGKTSLAKAMKSCFNEGDATRMRFAGPLKRMVRQLLMEAGVDAPSEYVDGDRKEEEIPGFPFDANARHLMQTLGTEWGREIVDKNIWRDLTMERAKTKREEGLFVMIDDARFPNEVEAIREAGGIIIRVQRDGHEWDNADEHASEGAIASISPDYVVENDRSLSDLKESADRLLANIESSRS